MKDKDFFPVLVVANKADLEYERQVGVHGQFGSVSFWVEMASGRRAGREGGRRRKRERERASRYVIC